MTSFSILLRALLITVTCSACFTVSLTVDDQLQELKENYVRKFYDEHPNNWMPSSCEDLWRIGHTLSALYSVMGVAMVENVYCDFTKLPNDAGKISVKNLLNNFLP
jgi:hypothetical protein